MIVLVYNADLVNEEPIKIQIDYFVPLIEVLNKFNSETGYGINRLYNRFGQELPFCYKVQKTGLDVYYHKPKSLVPVSSDSEFDEQTN